MEQFTNTPVRKLIHDALRGPTGTMSMPVAKSGTTQRHFGGIAQGKLTNSEDSSSSNSKSNLGQIANSVRHGIILDAVAKTPLLCQHMASYMYGPKPTMDQEEALLNFGFYMIVPKIEVVGPEQREDYLQWATGRGEQPTKRKNIYVNNLRYLSMVKFGLENYRHQSITTKPQHTAKQIASVLGMSRASYHRNGYGDIHNLLIDCYNELDAELLTSVYDRLAKREERASA